MTTYLALLRGINVGGNSKVEMKRLKAVFESLGYANVATYINSGNVLFDSQKTVSVAAIEKNLRQVFGFAIRVVVRDEKNIRQVAQSIPPDWQNDTDQKTDILFLWEAFDNRRSIGLLAGRAGIDNLKYVTGAIVWNINRRDYGKSAMNKFIGTQLYRHMTARNVNTVRKFVQLLEARRAEAA